MECVWSILKVSLRSRKGLVDTWTSRAPHFSSNRMKQLIYCSQCHNSVFINNAQGKVVPRKLRLERILLHCLKLGKLMHRNAEIKGCPFLVPEDVNKLRAGIWEPNTAHAKSQRERKGIRKK